MYDYIYMIIYMIILYYDYSMLCKVAQYVTTFYMGVVEWSPLLMLKMYGVGAEAGTCTLLLRSSMCYCVLCDGISGLIVSKGSREAFRKKMDVELIVNYL